MLTRLGLGSFLVLSLAGAGVSNSSDEATDAAGNASLWIDATPNGVISDAAPPTPDAMGIILPDARPSALVYAGDALPSTVASPRLRKPPTWLPWTSRTPP
ncbi:MAG: hypothetical protein GY811_29160 [Myxococcales bacterium]|nr:hypothetical protein [Myxococcales bacterium]